MLTAIFKIIVLAVCLRGYSQYLHYQIRDSLLECRVVNWLTSSFRRKPTPLTRNIFMRHNYKQEALKKSVKLR